MDDLLDFEKVKYLRVMTFCFLFIYPCLSFGQNTRNHDLENKLIGRCWEYNSYTNKKTNAKMEICFKKDEIYLLKLTSLEGILMGRDSNWVNWKIIGDIIYVENDMHDNEYCHFNFINDAPKFYAKFYDCTDFAHDELEIPWGEFVKEKSQNN